MAIEYKVYRGVKEIVFATVTETTDPETGKVTVTYGTPAPLAGARSITVETAQSTEEIPFDDAVRLTLQSEGATTLNITVSALADKTRAIIEGRSYDDAKKVSYMTPMKQRYFALGFKITIVGTKEEERWIWFYKGSFSGGNKSYNTKGNDTNYSTVDYTFTAVTTANTFSITDNTVTPPVTEEKSLKGVEVNPADLSEEVKGAFWTAVATPDKITPAVA